MNYKYYLIITPSPYNTCSGTIDYIKPIIDSATYGYAKLTDNSIIIKSNQDIEYWKNFFENYKDLNYHSGYFICHIDITKENNGRSDSKTWEWLRTNKKEILSTQCTAFEFEGIT